MSDASLEPARDLGRTSIPVGDYRLDVGPVPGMAITTGGELLTRADEQQRQLAQAAARADKDPGQWPDTAGDVNPADTPAGDGKLIDDVELVGDRADQVTTQVERADTLWIDVASGKLDVAVVNNELDTLFAVLQKLDRDGHFEQQLRLARALSKLLAVATRWLDLFRSLRELLGAAERHGHDEARAWALHELGTLHLAAGHLVRADHDLTRAAELRRRLNDERGRAATERNLQVLCRTLRQMMRTRRLVERRGIRRFIPASNAVLAALVIVALGAATAGAAGTGLLGGAGHGAVGTATAAGSGSSGTGLSGGGQAGGSQAGGGKPGSGSGGRSGGGENNGSGGAGHVSAPTVSAVSPPRGSADGGSPVTISGTEMLDATKVAFGGNEAEITHKSATSLEVTTPAGTGIVDVRVTTPHGTSGFSQADQYAYVPPPGIISVDPSSGEEQGGRPVTITGTNLSAVTEVDFGDAAVTPTTPPGDTTVAVLAPAKLATDPCAVTVKLITSDGLAASQPDAYTYRCPLPTSTSSLSSTSSSSSSSSSSSTTSSSSTATPSLK